MPPLPKPAIIPAKLLSSTSHRHPDKLLVHELFLSVPLDHTQPNGRRLRLFCRTAEPAENPLTTTPSPSHPTPKPLPIIVFIQGGPGFGARHPRDMPCVPPLLERGYRVLCLDHRGMGLSSAVTASTLAREGTPQKQADYLTHFRAPSAVQDLEAIRLCLTEHWTYPADQRQWSILGQSYGGWVCTSYLSMYPAGLREVFLFGGLPPVLQRKPDETVRLCVERVRVMNQRYYAKYPEDVARVKTVLEFLARKQVVLADGGRLSAGRFLEQGIAFAFHYGVDQVHESVLRAANDLETWGELTRPAIEGIAMDYDVAPLYALLHQPIYCQGEKSAWAFDRVVGELNLPEHYFTGETIFKRAYDDYRELQGLKDVAQILEDKADWGDLYDVDVLRDNKVPVYAAVYYDDMCVPVELSLQTARLIPGCKTYITNQLLHDAIRTKTSEVLPAVFKLRDDDLNLHLPDLCS
jgi:pimeloyl-ACP methyl ester carboxylesterase